MTTLDPPLEFTGERIHPDLPEWSYMFQVHLWGYRRFLEMSSPAWEVLDLGSGEGYGADLVAARCARCTGIDYSADAVMHARHRYHRDNLSFQVGDATRLPFDNASFDAVASLQVIEHLQDTSGYLSEVARVLRPGGLFFVTTPNRLVLSPEVLDNEFHFRDFDPGELADALRPVFHRVEVFGQSLDPGSTRAAALQQALDADLAERARSERAALGAGQRLWSAIPGWMRVRLRPIGHRLRPPHQSRVRELEAQVSADDFCQVTDGVEQSLCLVGHAWTAP
ncbi:MAG: class I SAM-dependent methyltransferase [Candidatus Dormibacteria bacterium]